MLCRTVKKFLSSYLDGELVLSQKERIEKHLSECADCRKELESLKGVVSSVSALGSSLFTIEPSPEILSRVRDRISQSPSVLRPQWLTLKSLMSGAVIIAIITGGSLYLQRIKMAKKRVSKVKKIVIAEDLLRPLEKAEVSKILYSLSTIGDESALGNFIIQSILDNKADSLATGQETSLELLAKVLKRLDVKKLEEISMEHPEYLGTGERRPPASGAYQEAAKLFIDASKITSAGASDATVEAIKTLEEGTLSYHVGGKLGK